MTSDPRDAELLALREERVHHLAALDALSVGLLVIDDQHRVLVSNRAFSQALGCVRSD